MENDELDQDTEQYEQVVVTELASETEESNVHGKEGINNYEV